MLVLTVLVLILGTTREMDTVSTVAVCISGALIFTTIQAQDFADVEGDMKMGRQTFPIYEPELSRQVTIVALILWSIFLSWFWKIGPFCSVCYMISGTIVGLRFYVLRDTRSDRSSYIIYNVSRVPCVLSGSYLKSP